jgi:hypothetical protein
MINFFKKHGVFMLMFLMFPVMWPVYAAYELTRSTSVTRNDCLEVWNLWLGGTLTYGVVCAILWGIYQAVLMLYVGGYLIPCLTVLAVVLLLIFIHISAPKILYYIFKNKKKSNE